MNTRRIVLLGLFIAMAGILHIVESWVPLPLAIPGVKLGLANVITLLVIIKLGAKDAFLVACLRVLLGSLFGGVLLGPAFAMSLAGAIVSTAAMIYAQRRWMPTFSLIGISVLGAALHNFAQMVTAAIIVGSLSMLWYLPYLLFFAVPTGLLTGLAACYFLEKMPTEPYVTLDQ